MKLFGVLVLMVMVTAACGLDCFICGAVKDPKSCTQTITCPPIADRCTTITVNGLMTKGCAPKGACINSIDCCEGNLCNSAVPTGSRVFLVLVSSALITLFL